MTNVAFNQPDVGVLQVHQSSSTIVTESGDIHISYPGAAPFCRHPAQRPSTKDKREFVRRFNAKVKNATENKTGQSVVADYSPLKEPDFEVCPVLLNVDFYRGVNAAGDQQYSPESNFSPSAEKWKGDQIKLEQLHDNLDKKRCRHVSLVGGAGCGKTTLLKRYTRELVDGRISLKPPERSAVCRMLPMPRRQRPYFVHFINVRDLPIGGTYTPSELLFKGMVKELSDDELNAGYDRLINRQESCVFVIDGLDQYDWELENESRKIDYDTPATVPSIIYNILCGELFPNAWVLTSSRQHKIRFFQDRLRADKTIVLNGLETHDIERLAGTLPKSDSTVWKRLSERCPNLLIMCRTPLFLIFTILVFICKTDFSLDTMAGVMTVFIQCFVESKHATNSKESSILSKLKELAYKGTMEKRVLFTEKDFRDVGLKSEEAQDLVIFAPKQTSIIVRERLFSNDYVMFFCHQSVQETLAMLHISEMKIDDYKSFVDKNINVPHFSVVRRLLCGFLLNKETYEASGGLFKVSDHVEKKIILSVLLRQALEAGFSTRDYMELLSSLYEAGSGAESVIDAHPPHVKLSREPLTPTDAYVLARVLSKMGFLESMELWDTCLNQEKMDILWKEIQKSNLKVRTMDFHSNNLYDFDCGILGDIISYCEVKELDINDCALTDDKIEKFPSSHRTKLTKLAVSRNEKLGAVGLGIIGNMVKNSKNEFLELKIDRCDLTKRKIKSLHRALAGTKIDFLDINYNRAMGTQGATTMGRVVEDCTVTTLDMSRCDQSPDEIAAFAGGLGEAKLKVLDITTHELKKTVTKAYVDAITQLLPHVSEELRMVDWRMNDKMKNLMQQQINTSAHPNFQLVYGHIGSSTLTKQ